MKAKFIVILIMEILIARFSFAHGTVFTQSQDVDNYIIQFEYNSFGVIAAGTVYDYDFKLLEKGSEKALPFDSAYVNFKNGSSDTLNANLVPWDTGVSRLTAALPGGNYTVEVSFNQKGQRIAETNFNLNVQVPAAKVYSSKSNFIQKYHWIVTLILGLVAGYFLSKIKTERKSNQSD